MPNESTLIVRTDRALRIVCADRSGLFTPGCDLLDALLWCESSPHQLRQRLPIGTAFVCTRVELSSADGQRRCEYTMRLAARSRSGQIVGYLAHFSPRVQTAVERTLFQAANHRALKRRACQLLDRLGTDVLSAVVTALDRAYRTELAGEPAASHPSTVEGKPRLQHRDWA